MTRVRFRYGRRRRRRKNTNLQPADTPPSRYAAHPVHGLRRSRVSAARKVFGRFFERPEKKPKIKRTYPRGVCVCVFALFSVCPSLPPVSVGGGDSKVDHRCRLRCGRRWSEIVFGHQSRRQYYSVVLRLKLYCFLRHQVFRPLKLETLFLSVLKNRYCYDWTRINILFILCSE